MLGGNLGDRMAVLAEAVSLMKERVGSVVGISVYYETEPWGYDSLVPFLNQAVAVETALAPEDLLKVLLEIETEMGRKRPVDGSYADRLIDLDILLYSDLVVETENLTIPHPELPNRRFALMPLHEIAPELIHPLRKLSVRDLLAHCADPHRAAPLAYAL